MSYHIYTTRGIVLRERPLREADRIYTILTRELGVIYATAVGVRKDTSKLRGNMEPVSISSISLVRGKEFWKVTSAEIIKRINISHSLARPLALVEKLVQGESPNPELFSAIEEALLEQNKDEEMFEISVVSRILFHLGYLKESDLKLDKDSLIRAINDGIQASHL